MVKKNIQENGDADSQGLKEYIRNNNNQTRKTKNNLFDIDP
jgi:hypothetical protein